MKMKKKTANRATTSLHRDSGVRVQGRGCGREGETTYNHPEGDTRLVFFLFFFLLFFSCFFGDLCSSIIIYYSFFWHTWTLPLPPLLCAIFSFFFLIIMEESSFFFRFFASQVFKTFLGDYLYFFQDRRKDKGAMKIFLFPLSHYEPEAWWMVHYYFFFFFFYYFLKKKFWRARRYAHSTFDLRGVGCRPPLLLQKPLYACWQPGSKGCKTFSGLFYSIVSGNINLPYSYSLPPQEGKQTRILQLLFMWKFKKKKNFFISQR